MALTHCIYCSKALDGSKEHIIPDALNGRLISKEIICAACNNKFGLKIDPAFKTMLNPLLIALGFDNANHTHAEGLDGETYKMSRTGEVTPIKDEVKIVKDGTKTILSVSAPANRAEKVLKKQAEKLTKGGKEFKGYLLVEKESQENGFRTKFELKITPEVILGLNKIATEFYAYNQLDVGLIKGLLDRLNILDGTLNNVTFCNWNCDIRELDYTEITHLLVLRRRDSDHKLYCYIELFNVICVCIPLCDNFPQAVNLTYYQNAVTGERIEKQIQFNQEFIFYNNIDGDFEILINALFERLNELEFKKIYTTETLRIGKQYKSEKEKGLIPPDEEHDLGKRLGEMLAHLSLQFPYMISDFHDELNDDLNYTYSNMRDEEFEEFCEKYKVFVGKDFKIGSKMYTFESFLKVPFIKCNGVQMIKVYCRFVDQNTGKRKVYLYFTLFEMIKKAYP